MTRKERFLKSRCWSCGNSRTWRSSANSTQFSCKNFLDYIELSDKISIIEINVKDEWLYKPLAKLNLRSKYGLNVIAIRRNNELQTDIGPNLTFEKGDTILVVTDKHDLGL